MPSARCNEKRVQWCPPFPRGVEQPASHLFGIFKHIHVVLQLEIKVRWQENQQIMMVSLTTFFHSSTSWKQSQNVHGRLCNGSQLFSEILSKMKMVWNWVDHMVEPQTDSIAVRSILIQRHKTNVQELRLEQATKFWSECLLQQ